jgi:signal transduction histidine kinase
MDRGLAAKNMLFPFVLSGIMFGIILLVVVPDRQSKIVGENKENELLSIARTIALTVEIALEQERLEALAELNTLLKDDAHISVAGIFVDKGDFFELMTAFPSELDAELAAGVDPIKFLVASSPFESRNLSGYIEVGFNREQLASQLQKINLALYIAFIAILILQITVYRIVQLVRRQQQSEHKAAAAQIIEAKFKIEATLETRTNELKESQLQLIQTEKLETIGTLSTGVAHEVKNPLAILQLGVDYLNKKAHGSPAINEVIGEMEDAIQRAAKVINQLLDFSASRDLDLSKINLSELIGNALGLVKHEIVKAKIEVNSVNLDANLFIVGDRHKLQQVLINIFMNSIQAIESNGMIEINAQKKKMGEIDFDITASYELEDEIIEITIDDNGSGIAENKLNKVFDPFFTTKLSGEGTGLGLTVVQNILRLHKAKIHYENKQGGGVKVTILINRTGD